MLEIKAKGENLKKELELEYQKKDKKRDKEKKSFVFHDVSLDSPGEYKNVDFNL